VGADTRDVDNTGDLTLLLGSNHPLIFVETREETRAIGFVRAAASALDLPVWLWSLTEGLSRDGENTQYGTESIDAAIDFIRARADRGVFVLRDAAPALEDDTARRRLREAVQHGPNGQSIVITGADLRVKADLADVAHEWYLTAPSPAELERLARRTLEDLAARGLTIAIGPRELRQMVTDLAGLTMNEAERTIQRAAVEDGRIDAADLPRIRQTKAAILNQDGILELIEASGFALDDVGGLTDLKGWLQLRHRVFLEPCAARHLDAPRGILLTGIPGCGKSLVAKAIAHSWQLPLVLLDPGRLYGKYVGESEQRLQQTLAVIESLSPAVLWIDEIEKGFASSGDGDGGVSQRVLGTFLRWLQERAGRIFLVATSNDVRALPPELLRKGRFDEIFFVDIPGEDHRLDIIELHLRARDQDTDSIDSLRLATVTEGFSGAELETMVVGALYRTFADGTTLTTEDLLTEAATTVPLTRSRAEEMASLRQWAAARARSA